MTGDILGFVFIFAILATQMPWIAHFWGMAANMARRAGNGLRNAILPIRSWFVRIFWYASIALVAGEAVFTAGLFTASEAHWKWWFWILMGCFWLVSLGQLYLARRNLVFGQVRQETWEEDDGAGNMVEMSEYVLVHENAVMRSYGVKDPGNLPELHAIVFRSHPVIWLALIAYTALWQGFTVQWHAVLYEPYFAAQSIIALGFMSKLVYGITGTLVAALLGAFIVKGTRATEVLSTLAAKLGLAALPHLTFKNALENIGGEIDYLDEQKLASIVSTLLLASWMPFVPYDFNIFLLPHPYVAVLSAFIIVLMGMLSWIFSRSDKYAAEEVAEKMKNGRRILLMVAFPYAIVVLTAGWYLHGDPQGQNVLIALENFRYGLTFITHGSMWWYIGALIIAVLAEELCRRGWIFFREVAKRPATPPRSDDETLKRARHEHGEENWHKTILGWASNASAVLSGVAIICGFLSVVGMITACSSDRIRLPKVGEDVPKVVVGWNDAPPPDEDLKQIVFYTAKPAQGIVEFEDLAWAREVGLPGYLSMTSGKTKEAVESCSFGQNCEGYRHFVKLPRVASGIPPYKIVMRNDDEAVDKVNPVFGYLTSVEATDAKAFSESVKPPEPGVWARIKRWWSGDSPTPPSSSDEDEKESEDKSDEDKDEKAPPPSSTHRSAPRAKPGKPYREPTLEVDPYYQRMLANEGGR
ncbi:MAG: hypothetical protein ACOYUZ_04365 [Patescibacteria group bacterium]